MSYGRQYLPKTSSRAESNISISRRQYLSLENLLGQITSKGRHLLWQKMPQCRRHLGAYNVSVQKMFWCRKDSEQITSHWGRTIYEGRKPLGEGQYIRAEIIWGRYLSRSDNVAVQTISQGRQCLRTANVLGRKLFEGRQCLGVDIISGQTLSQGRYCLKADTLS